MSRVVGVFFVLLAVAYADSVAYGEETHPNLQRWLGSSKERIEVHDRELCKLSFTYGFTIRGCTTKSLERAVKDFVAEFQESRFRLGDSIELLSRGEVDRTQYRDLPRFGVSVGVDGRRFFYFTSLYSGEFQKRKLRKDIKLSLRFMPQNLAVTLIDDIPWHDRLKNGPQIGFFMRPIGVWSIRSFKLDSTIHVAYNPDNEAVAFIQFHTPLPTL